jgi:hypothetical protein
MFGSDKELNRRVHTNRNNIATSSSAGVAKALWPFLVFCVIYELKSVINELMRQRYKIVWLVRAYFVKILTGEFIAVETLNCLIKHRSKELAHNWIIICK